jgi:integrase/recombinase XerD
MREFVRYLRKRKVTDLRAVRRKDILSYQAALMGTILAPQTIHCRLRAVRRLYEWLEDHGKILMNPAVDIPMPKLETRLPRVVLTPAEMRKILAAPDTSLPMGIRDKAILETLYSTGIRLAELCHLTIHDVDIPNGYLRINSGKGCKDRVVPLGGKAKSYLSEYLRRVRGRFTEGSRDERALFVGGRRGHGHGLRSNRIDQIVRHYARLAKIRRRVSPHVFRHSCATHLLAGGADISQVQRLLGHVMINTTQVYTRVAVPDVRKTHRRTHPRERERIQEDLE